MNLEAKIVNYDFILKNLFLYGYLQTVSCNMRYGNWEKLIILVSLSSYHIREKYKISGRYKTLDSVDLPIQYTTPNYDFHVF